MQLVITVITTRTPYSQADSRSEGQNPGLGHEMGTRVRSISPGMRVRIAAVCNVCDG